MKKINFKLIGVVAVGGAIAGSLIWLGLKRVEEAQALESIQEVKVEIPINVKTISLTHSSLQQWVRGTGNARASRREFLSFQTSGRVEQIALVNGRELQPGDAVYGPTAKEPQGMLLAHLDDTMPRASLRVARSAVKEALEQEKVSIATLDQAKAKLQFAQKRLNRESELLKSNATSQEAFDSAESDQSDAQVGLRVANAQLQATRSGIDAATAKLEQAADELDNTNIYSPIDGIVAYRNLKVGWQFSSQLVRMDTEGAILSSMPFVVIDPSSYEIIVNVPAFESGQLAAGQRVVMQLSSDQSSAALGDGVASSRVISGVVDSVTPAVNPEDRSVRVRVKTTAGADLLKDGMYVKCNILVNERKDVLVLPFSAMILRDRQMHVYVVGNDNRVAMRELTIGSRNDDEFEIVAGLEAGDQIVTKGRYKLSAGALVEIR